MIGKRRGGLLVAMPCFNEYQLLLRHLDILTRQSFQDFDLLIVLGKDFDGQKLVSYALGKKFKFGIIVCRRNSDSGSAGGFAAGQKYALENGYKYVILADVDCLPRDKRLIERLYGSRQAGFVSPTEAFDGEDGFRFAPDSKNRDAYTPVTHYCLYSIGLVKKYGLMFAPIYTGADDAEYAERIREKREFIGCAVAHPFAIGDTVCRKPASFWLYVLNTLAIIKSKRRIAFNFLRAAFSVPVMFLFFPKYGHDLSKKIAANLASFTYGKKALESLKTDIGPYIAGREEFDYSRSRKIFYSDFPVPNLSLAKKIAGELFACFGKSVSIERSTSDLLITALAVSAKELHCKVGANQYLLVAKNKNPLAHAAKLLAFAALFLPFALLLLGIYLPSKLIRQPKTLGYGLN